ncbi:MAG: TldD/PmbA family protein [Methanosarcinales archaeon]
MNQDIDQIMNLAQQAVDIAIQAGADEVEVFGLTGRSVHVDIQKDKIDLARESFAAGHGIKAIVSGAVGFSSTNDPSGIRNSALLAVGSAKVRNSDPDWIGLPARSDYRIAKGIFDPGIDNMDIDACIDLSMMMIDGAVSVKDTIPISGKFICSSFSYGILNSSGVEVQEDSTRIDGFFDCRAGEGNELSTAFEFDISRSLNIDFFHIGHEAASEALKSMGGVSIDTSEMDVLLKPNAIADILESTFCPSISAENIQKERSALIGKLENQIGVGELDIIDDGLMENGIGSSRCDDEGVGSKCNRIIESGVLKTYLYDTYTAGKAGMESTGNATRDNYAQTTSIDARNLKIEYPASDIVAETNKGVIIDSVIGAHTANPISGDFSVEARNSFLIENGEITSPVKSMMISGNMFDLLQNIIGAGRDDRVLGNIITPTLKISGLKVIG